MNATDASGAADHFSGHAKAYLTGRPDYPDALFEWLAEQAPARRLAVDVGCGNGQATRGLASHFEAVLGTDMSGPQITRAQGAENVQYVVAPADHLPVEDGTCDLLTAAQAAHWFDHDAFHAEAERVLTQGGVLALWTYEMVRVTDRIDTMLDALRLETLGPDWPPERRHVDAGYATLPFPYPELGPPDLMIEREWRSGDLLAYVESWSALQRHRARTGTDPLSAFGDQLREAWGDCSRLASWQLRMRVGRKP